MLAQATEAIRYTNCHSVVNFYSDVNVMIKLIRKTDIFKI